MKDLLVKVFSNGQVFLPNNVLGYEGEHIARNIIVKMDNFIDGVAILEIDPKKEETGKHFLTMDKQEETYTLPVYESLLTEKELDMQLVITFNEEVVFKSEVFTFQVGNSINAKDKEFLEEYASYVTQINEGLSKIDKTIDDLNEKVESGYFKGEQGLQGPAGKDGTMTFEDLTSEQIESLKGPQGVAGQDATVNGLNTVEIKAGENISIIQDESSLTINGTKYDDTQIKEDIKDLQDNKANIDDIPTKTSDLINDSGYITKIPEGLATEEYVDGITGAPNNLNTTDKTNLVNAINEVLGNVKNSDEIKLEYFNESVFIFEGKKKGFYFIEPSLVPSMKARASSTSTINIPDNIMGKSLVVINELTEDTPYGTILAIAIERMYNKIYAITYNQNNVGLSSTIASKNQLAPYLLDTTTTVSSNYTFGNIYSNKIPISNNQLTNKKYVDDQIIAKLGDINTILATLTTPTESGGTNANE